MNELQQFQQLKRKADKVKADIQRASGALDSRMVDLKTRFGVSTLEEARAKLKEMESYRDEAKQDYHSKLAEFKDKWSDKFDQLD